MGWSDRKINGNFKYKILFQRKNVSWFQRLKNAKNYTVIFKILNGMTMMITISVAI